MKKILQRLGLTAIFLLSFLTTFAYDIEVDGIYYDVDVSDFTCTVVSGDSKYSGDIVIPAEVIYSNRTLIVTNIGCAFQDCSSLASIDLPDSLTEIGESAFSGCSSLASIDLPDSLTVIGNRAFEGCSSLASIDLPDSLTEIGESAFYGCSSLASVDLPDSLTMIGNSAFGDCSSLASITIPGSVLFMGYNCFGSCDNLREARFEHSDNNKTLSTSNFCFPESVEYLYLDREFSDAVTFKGGKELIIGSHISNVCVSTDNIETIITCLSPNEPPVWDYSFSKSQYMNLTVKVPIGSLEAYQQVIPWKYFWNLQEADLSGVGVDVTAESDVTETGRYDLNGRPITDGYEGIVIIRYSDGSARKVISAKR